MRVCLDCGKTYEDPSGFGCPKCGSIQTKKLTKEDEQKGYVQGNYKNGTNNHKLN
jgi:rRNA maturation endonuclease Nob1